MISIYKKISSILRLNNKSSDLAKVEAAMKRGAEVMNAIEQKPEQKYRTKNQLAIAVSNINERVGNLEDDSAEVIKNITATLKQMVEDKLKMQAEINALMDVSRHYMKNVTPHNQIDKHLKGSIKEHHRKLAKQNV